MAFRGAAGSKSLRKLKRLHVQISPPVMPQLGDAAVIAQGICFGEEPHLDSLHGLLRQSANFVLVVTLSPQTPTVARRPAFNPVSPWLHQSHELVDIGDV